MREVCVVTGSRAEYGLLRWLLEEIRRTQELRLRLLVTGTHLSRLHGHTVDEIEADGHAIDARIPLDLEDDSRPAAGRALGQAVAGCAEAFARIAPDVVVLLGDRYEILGAAQAALLQRIPIAHLHGGELTEGAFDDAIRHAITKMASLHFVATDTFGRRVVQMGEAPERVYAVGALALDAIAALDLLEGPALAEALGHHLEGPLFLVTFHPETATAAQPAAQLSALLQALDAFPDAQVLVTRPNADPGHRSIREGVDAWAARHPQRVHVHDSLGQLRYLSALRRAEVVIGNSSSGIIEAPAIGTATVNIGARQTGRPRAASVVDCDADAASIRAAIERARSRDVQAQAALRKTPYGGPGAARRIAEVLRRVPLEDLARKRFRDLPGVGVGDA